jgi:hypothetical protein
VIHLIVTLKGRTIGRFDVEGDSVRVGRLPDNEVQINNQSVSRVHCMLERDGEGWVLEDKGSHNGTYLNGAKITQPSRIRSGDSVGVGQFHVAIRTEGEALLASSSMGTRISVRASRDPETREKLATEKGYLLRENSPGAPIVLARDLCQFGSAKGSDVYVEGATKLAFIVRGYGGFQLVNVGAPQDVSQNAMPVPNRVWLVEDDELVVGTLRFTFYCGLPMDDDNQATMFLQRPPG